MTTTDLLILSMMIFGGLYCLVRIVFPSPIDWEMVLSQIHPPFWQKPSPDTTIWCHGPVHQANSDCADPFGASATAMVKTKSATPELLLAQKRYGLYQEHWTALGDWETRFCDEMPELCPKPVMVRDVPKPIVLKDGQDVLMNINGQIVATIPEGSDFDEKMGGNFREFPKSASFPPARDRGSFRTTGLTYEDHCTEYDKTLPDHLLERYIDAQSHLLQTNPEMVRALLLEDSNRRSRPKSPKKHLRRML